MPFLVDYQVLEEEIWVEGAFQPLVVMEWVEGMTLYEYLNQKVIQNDRDALMKLALKFDQLGNWLIQQPFGHGDLKPDNL